jgi:hypothetical protein
MASAEVLKLLVPALIAWRKVTERGAMRYLQQEDSMSPSQLASCLKPLSAYLEAARMLDAGFMVFEGRLFVPYRYVNVCMPRVWTSA